MSEDRFQGGKEKGRPGTVGGQTAREDISGERGPFELDEDRVLEAFPAPFEDQDDPFPDFPIRPLTEKAHSQRPVTETPLEIDLRLKDKARPWPPAFPQEQAEVPAVAKPKPIDWSAAKTQDGMRRLAEEADALPDLTLSLIHI